MNPQYFGTDPTDIRTRSRINPKFRIRIPDHICFKFWRCRRFEVWVLLLLMLLLLFVVVVAAVDCSCCYFYHKPARFCFWVIRDYFFVCYSVKAELCDHCCLSFLLSVSSITHKSVYWCRPNMVRRGDPLEVIKFWCWFGSGCESRISVYRPFVCLLRSGIYGNGFPLGLF